MVKLLKTDSVRLNDGESIIDLDRFSLHKLAKNEYEFSTVVNVPTDGWCLLYSIQLAMFIDHGIALDLLGIRLTMLNEFEKRVKDEQDSLRDFFTAFESETEEEPGDESIRSRFNKRILSSHSDPLKSNIQINQFLLLRYLDQRVFNSCALDLGPHLLSSGLRCHIRVYLLSGDQIRYVEDYGLINSPILVHILHIKDQLHFVPLLKSDGSSIDHQVYSRLVRDNLKSPEKLVDQLASGNEFYGRVAKNFQKNIELYTSGDEKLKKIRQIDPKLICSLKPHLSSSLFSLASANSNSDRLIRRFQSKFATENDLKHFVENPNACSQSEELNFQRVLQSLHQFDSSNYRILSNPLVLLITFLMRMTSLSGVYSRLNLIISVRDKSTNQFVGYFMNIPPYGILVDKECLNWCVLVVLSEKKETIRFLGVSEHLFKAILLSKWTVLREAPPEFVESESQYGLLTIDKRVSKCLLSTILTLLITLFTLIIIFYLN